MQSLPIPSKWFYGIVGTHIIVAYKFSRWCDTDGCFYLRPQQHVQVWWFFPVAVWCEMGVPRAGYKVLSQASSIVVTAPTISSSSACDFTLNWQPARFIMTYTCDPHKMGCTYSLVNLTSVLVYRNLRRFSHFIYPLFTARLINPAYWLYAAG